MNNEMPKEAGPCELTQLRARVRELEADYETVVASNKVYEREVPELRHRIRELEEVMPDPQKMRATIHACFHGHTDAWDKLDAMADRIEKVMKR